MGININVPKTIQQNTPLMGVRSGATAEPDDNVKYVPQSLTDAQKAQARENIGAGTSNFSGNYNDLTNKPTIPAAQVQANWNETDTTSAAYIQNKPTIPAAQVQADWNQSDNAAVDYIKNKPTITTDVAEDLSKAIIVYSDRDTTFSCSGPILYVIKNGVRTDVNDTSCNISKGKNIIVSDSYYQSRIGDANGIYTIVTSNSCEQNTLLYNKSYTNKIKVVYFQGGYHNNACAQSIIFNMNNKSWQNIWVGEGDVVFVDKTMDNLSSGMNPASSTSTNHLYVPRTRYNEFVTKLQSIWADQDISTITSRIVLYDFLSWLDYEPAIVTLPTLPLTMTDANGNTIDGDFVAQNVTITPAV